MPFVRNYGDRPILRGGAWNEQIGIFDTLLNERSNVQYYIIGFRAYGERLIGRNSRSVTASGIFDIELNSRREVNTQERGFRASSELW